MVGQIAIVGVLMIIQGVFDAIAGIAIGFYAFFMPRFMMELEKNAQAQGQPGPQLPADFEMWMMIGGGVFSAVITLLGVLTILAGVRVIQHRSRIFDIIVLCCGVFTVATCYCLPTSIALAVYGLIVLLSAPVELAFRLRSQGFDTATVQRAFLSAQ